MSRALISPENSTLRNAAGFCVAMVVIPIVIIVKLIVMPFERPVQRSATEVLSFLRDFYDGAGDDHDWDDFTSIPLADAELENIRVSAASLDLPMGTEEMNNLRALIAAAEAIAERDQPL